MINMPERQRIEIDEDDDTVGAYWDEMAQYDLESETEDEDDSP